MKNVSAEYEFSIIRGGFLDQFLGILGVLKPDKDSTLRKILFFVLVTWVPLLALSAFEGLLWGKKVDLPFFKEFATHIRFLIAIPLFVVAEGIVDHRVKLSLKQFNRSGLLTEEGKVKFESAKKTADRMCESLWAEALILVLIYLSVFFRISINPVELTSWLFPDAGNLSLLSYAGYWAAFVSFPLFQFIILRWVWRWIIWWRLLNMVSKSDLRLIPTHPDTSGGLGFLGESPLPFSVFTLVLSIVFSAMLAERMLFLDFNLQEHYPLLIAFILMCVLINVLPLLTFISPMSEARIKGINDYHALIALHHHNLEDKWIVNPQNGDEILGNADFSSAADIMMIYQATKSMSIFPFNIKTMVVTVVISLLPLLVVFAIQMPLIEILKMLAGFLL